jgi:hypothetical protein
VALQRRRDHRAAGAVLDLDGDAAGALAVVVRGVALVVEPRVSEHAAGAEHRDQERHGEQGGGTAVAPAALLPSAGAPLIAPAVPLVVRRAFAVRV